MRESVSPRVQQAVVAWFDARNRRNLASWMETMTPEAVVHDPVGAAPASGREELEETWNATVGPFESLSIEADDMFGGGDSVAVPWSGRVVGQGTGKEIEIEGISVFEIDSEGRIETAMTWWDPGDALLRAAGEAVD